MKKIILKQTGFNFGWKPVHVEPATLKGEFYGPRKWQKKAFKKSHKEPFVIINAPMGSGKSWLMCLLAVYKLQKDPNLRCIIAVPQTIIASGFEEANLLMPGTNKELRWFAQHNMCMETPSEGTIKTVIKFLKGPYGFLQDRVLLCTHATIIAVYKRLKETKQLKLLHNLVCWIDEAHHLKNALVEGLEDATISNGMGELVNYLTRYGKNVHLGLATASFFRGDRLSLLTPKMEEQFVRFNLPYDDYLESMKYLRSFNFDFLLSGPDFIKGIRTLLKTRIGKDIIYIPSPNSRCALGCKYETCDQIIEAYRKVFGGKRIDRDDGVTILRRKDGKELKILDLVQEELRKDKKAFVGKIKDKDDLDVVIALGMFKEGANWIWADRAIIVGARSSLLDEFQMIGRLFRDAKGKKNVEVVQLLPFSLDQTNSEKFRDNLNNYLKAIYASLILENIFNPVKIQVPKGKKKKTGSLPESVDWLSELLPDDAAKLSLIEDVSNTLMGIIDTPSIESVDLWEEYNSVLPDILDSYGIKSHVDEISKQIWGMFAKRTLSVAGTSIDKIDFNILQQASPIEFITKYTSGVCNIDTFRKLRSAIGQFNSADENKKKLLKLAMNGEPRPDGRLGNLLCNYLAKKGKCHDLIFEKEIRKLRPDWFVNTADENKKKLLEIAKKKECRPAKNKHPLGKVLINYTNEGPCYDPVFEKELRKLRPDWFVNSADENKKKLLEIARNSEDRPTNKTLWVTRLTKKVANLGTALLSYTKKGSSYDPIFDKKIRKLRPDWFVNSADENKKKLLEMAKNGEPRPQKRKHPLGDRLVNYTNQKASGGSSYDSVFNKKIRELRPDWFVAQHDICDEKKEQLLKMAKAGELRPVTKKHPLGSVLCTYTCSASGSYDPVFDKKIRKLAPQWFINTVDNKKEQLLKMAEEGVSRPPEKKHFLGNALSSYTCSKTSSYDPVFDKKIRTLRPDWFLGVGKWKRNAS